MRMKVCLLVLILKANFLLAQDVYFIEDIEPESSFEELRRSVKENPLPQIEKAFLQWDYALIKPYLVKEIRKPCQSFFKENKGAMAQHTWTKQTHTGPSNWVIPGGNFGFIRNSNSLRLQSSDKEETFIVDYYYYVRDSAFVIWAVETSRYPYKIKLNAELKLWVQLDSSIQSLRKSVHQKNTQAIAEKLTTLESFRPTLVKVPNFHEGLYARDLSAGYGNLSWYLIFEGKYESAIAAAQKGLSHDETQTWIYTNLALSNLLAGHKDIALTIYGRYKDQQMNTQESFKAVFKKDLVEVKRANRIDSTLYDEILLFLE